MRKKILAIFAHPDDEIIGCGATLAKRVNSGDDVNLILLSNGVGSRANSSNREIKQRIKNCEESCKFLGLNIISIGNFPDNEFDKIPLLKVIKFIEKETKNFEPDEVFTHFKNDLNIDHRITYQSTKTVFRPINIRSNKFKFFESEINSSTEWINDNQNSFNPNHFENVDNFLDSKITALKYYKDELREWPHSRSIKGVQVLAEYRGMCSNQNLSESFILNLSKN